MSDPNECPRCGGWCGSQTLPGGEVEIRCMNCGPLVGPGSLKAVDPPEKRAVVDQEELEKDDYCHWPWRICSELQAVGSAYCPEHKEKKSKQNQRNYQRRKIRKLEKSNEDPSFDDREGKPGRKKGPGALYKRGDVWWIRLRHNGKVLRESSCSDDKAVAEDLLKKRRGEAAGKPRGVK